MHAPDELKALLVEMLPFLEEAWKVCFPGGRDRLLSAEERGMGYILSTMREWAKENYVLPPGVISSEESSKRVENATQWAHRLLGSPNELHSDLREWVGVGETCADGLKKANAEVVRLRAIAAGYCDE